MAKFFSRIRKLTIYVEQPDPEKGNPGKKIEFENGFYETDDKDEIDAIQKYGANVVVESDQADSLGSNDNVIRNEDADKEEREVKEAVTDNSERVKELQEMKVEDVRTVAQSLGISTKDGDRKKNKKELIEEIIKIEAGKTEDGEAPTF